MNKKSRNTWESPEKNTFIIKTNTLQTSDGKEGYKKDDRSFPNFDFDLDFTRDMSKHSSHSDMIDYNEEVDQLLKLNTNGMKGRKTSGRNLFFSENNSISHDSNSEKEAKESKWDWLNGAWNESFNASQYISTVSDFYKNPSFPMPDMSPRRIHRTEKHDRIVKEGFKWLLFESQEVKDDGYFFDFQS